MKSAVSAPVARWSSDGVRGNTESGVPASGPDLLERKQCRVEVRADRRGVTEGRRAADGEAGGSARLLGRRPARL